MKRFVINFGNRLIDFCAGTFIILILIAAYVAFSAEENSAAGFGILVGGLLIFVIAFYYLYLLMDISDSLKIIAKNTETNTAMNTENSPN